MTKEIARLNLVTTSWDVLRLASSLGRGKPPVSPEIRLVAQGQKSARGVVDTSVVIAGAAAFRGAPLHPETGSGKLLLRWIAEGHFQLL
jgi:hypothetical protein